MKLKGSYILVLNLTTSHRLKVGKLGSFGFAPGCYLYFGSALNGLNSRISRHLKQDKKPHWHIDNLAAVANATHVWYAIGNERWECAWAKAVAENPYATIPAQGFGSSDCRCDTHLLHLPDDSHIPLARATLLQTCPALADWPAENTSHHAP